MSCSLVLKQHFLALCLDKLFEAQHTKGVTRLLKQGFIFVKSSIPVKLLLLSFPNFY